jgi:MoaA/NifB/PqqE/SkfB family radical SAM enzyme
MMNLLKLAARIPLYNLTRITNSTPPYPFNLTISITNKCNSMCKTCNIWKYDKKKYLSLGEWEKILKSIGDSTFWITMSGGEPFLNEHINEIARMISKYNKPAVITIPTNGILTQKIVKNVKEIMNFYKGILIVNISIDGVGKKHDYIRGVKCFDNALKTYKLLKRINNKNLSVGIHTVISKYNAKDFYEIRKFVKKLSPDSFIVEISENRKELNNIKDKISPDNKEYFKIIEYMRRNKIGKKGISRITNIFRDKYYKSTKCILKNKKYGMQCYAATASVHIKADGNIVACCMKEESIGNLKKKSFSEIWNSKKAARVRQVIKKRKCSCTLANVYYSNRICEWI